MSNGFHVAIVEDDRRLANVLKLKLNALGYETTLLVNGQEAIDFFTKGEHVPDVVLLDIMLPIRNGLEVLRFMKSKEELKQISVIVVSNLGKQQDIQEALHLGANEYIVKANMTLAKIVERVQSYVTKEG
jgi:two-component system alkaline phosphatase synthesis response regulator PhoP